MARYIDNALLEQLAPQMVPDNSTMPVNSFRNNSTGLLTQLQSAPMGGGAAVNYAAPVEYMGKKGFYGKDDPSQIYDANGRLLAQLTANPEEVMRQQDRAFQLKQREQQLSQGALEQKKLQMEIDRSKRPKAPEGYMWSADGSVVQKIPGFEDGKPLTEFQGKSATFGQRANEADKIINTVGASGDVQPGLLKRAADSIPGIGSALGMAANFTQTPQQQQIEQAQRDFVNAVLRQESGAAISMGEFDNAKKQYFPQPGDSQQVIAQKALNRQNAIKGFQVEAGEGWNRLQNATQKAVKPGTMKDGYMFMGGDPAQQSSWKKV